MSDAVVVHPAEGRFDLLIDAARRGHLDYSLPDTATMVIEYVEVDPDLRGRAHGERLVSAAVDWARAGRRMVVPMCSFARRVIAQTPAFHDVWQRE